MLRPLIHYGGHFLAPAIIAKLYDRKHWPKNWGILIATMLVDLDHLLADPIFDPERLSLGFHPLHSWWAISIYFLLLFYKPLRLIAIGLCFHMFIDGLDYLLIDFSKTALQQWGSKIDPLRSFFYSLQFFHIIFNSLDCFCYELLCILRSHETPSPQLLMPKVLFS